MKLRKQIKKVTAFICAIALVVTGLTYSPVNVNADTSWISVSNVPATAGGKKSKYRLGTTTDTSADGKWYLEVSNNQWANWNGRYMNADGIEGFTFDNQVYNNRGGVFLWSTDLKTEFGLTAGTTYNMSVTISYSGVNKAQNNFILTNGGSTDMDISRTVAAGTSTETYQAQVVPSSSDFIMRISWTSVRYETAEKGTFAVTDVTFTEVAPETMPPNYASVTALAGGSAEEGTEGLWQYTVIPGEGDGNTWAVNATFGPCNTVDGFTATLSKYCWAGSFWKVSDLKTACVDSDNNALVVGETYTCTVTITEAPTDSSKPHTPITVSTIGGTENLTAETQTSYAGEALVWTGTVVPGNADLVLAIGYGNDGGAGGLDGQAGTFTVNSVVLEKAEPETLPQNYASVTALAGGTAAEGTEGIWQYTVIPGEGNGYTWDVGATFGPCNAVNGFTATLSKYCWAGSFWKVTNMKTACRDTQNNTLVAGQTYTCTVTITETPSGNSPHTPMTVSTTGGITNLAPTTKTSTGNSLVWTGTVIPAAGALVLAIGYGNDGGSGGLEAQPGSFTVNSVVFEKVQTTGNENNYAALAPAGGADSGSAGLWNYTLISGDNGQGSTWDVSALLKNTNTIEGFRAEIGQYSWDGSYWNASDLKQEYGLIPGNTYNCSVTVRPLCTNATTIHVSTSGGETNLESSDKTGTSANTLTWTGQVEPKVAPLQLNIGYGNDSFGQGTGGEAGGFEVVDVTFTLVTDYTNTCTIGSQSTTGVWTYNITQNADNNQSSNYYGASAVDGFTYYHNTFSQNGANWSASNLKTIYNLTAGTTYNCTVTIKPLCHYATNFHVKTTGGSTNLTDTDKSGSASANLTWTGEVVPSSGALTLDIGYGNDTNGDGTGAAVGGFKVVSVSFTTETLSAPKSVAAYNFYAVGNGYQIVYVPTYSGAVSYNLYVDNNSTPIMNIPVTDCERIDKKKNVWSIKNNLPASTFSTYADDTIHNLYLATVDGQGNVSAKSKAAPVRITSAAASNAVANHPTDISRVYITTNSATNIDTLTKATSKQDAALSIVSSNTNIIKNATYYGTVKLRGNSTSMADKKAYNISFNSKQKVMANAEKGKKWCLLANAYEKTMMRNKLAMDFGLLMGNVNTPEEHYVDVYMNGTYKGTYVISEPAENGYGGVSYNEDGDDVLFEYEAERDETGPDGGVAYYTTAKCRMRFVNEEFEDEVNEIYNDGATSAELVMNYMKRYNPKFLKWTQTLDDFETALVDTSSTDYQDYIDEDSFVDMYIINELFKTLDFTYSSVKFYVTYDEQTGAPTIHAGPLWDFDLSSGNVALAEIRSYNENPLRGQINPWFKKLMQNPTFVNKVKARYQELQPQIQNLYVNNYLGTNKIDQNNSEMQASRIRNYTAIANGGAGWSVSAPDSYEYTYAYGYSTISPFSSYTYDQHISYLRTWLQNRNEYLVQTWGLSLEYEEPTTEEPTTEEPTTAEPTTAEPTTADSEPEADFKIASKTLALSSGISLVFKVNKSLFENRYEEPKLVVLLDGVETEITEYTDEGSRYAFEFTKITPDKMNVMVEATLHATKNGKEYVSAVTEYSVATYVYNMLNKYGETAGMETFRTLLVDLLNYGTASQNYTGFNTDNPANSELTATQRSWGRSELGELTSVKNNKYVTIENPSVTWKSSGLALQDAVIVKMKFQTESTDGLIMRVTDDYGTTWDIEPEDFELAAGTTNQYYINFKGFNVGRMSESMYFTAYRNGVVASNTYCYSVESYVDAHKNDVGALGELVVAMMKYGKSAQAYIS